MSPLDRLLPLPRLLERDSIDLAAEPAKVFAIARHLDLGKSRLVHALFAVRTWPSRLVGSEVPEVKLGIDQLRSTQEHPGFQVLIEEPFEFAVGAIGKVWYLDIPFVHVADAAAFAAYDESDQIKVAWSLAVEPLGAHDSRLSIEVRVDATDDRAWKKFRSYFRLIGPGSRFIRHSLLQALARELGTPDSKEGERPLPGDELLPDAAGTITQGITIEATPKAIWPWLVQMGCHRAGFYSYDLLDNAGVASAHEIHAELQRVQVGDVLPASPDSKDGFEVLRLEPQKTLVLGGLYDAGAGKQLAFASPRPERFWQVTWAFSLEPLDAKTTRLHVRARASIPETGRFHLAWIAPVHSFMESAQLRHLKARVEGPARKDGAREILSGLGGAAVMVSTLLTPFLRAARSHWGVDAETAARVYPGDELVAEPYWGWTHGIEIDAPAESVWPWIAQIGADRGGFYSHQWLENVAGCEVQNAETIHPDWAAKPGDALSLHPKTPPLSIVQVEPGRFLVAHGAADPAARAAGKPWMETSWLFFVEPLADGRSRFISRFRVRYSDDLTARLGFGPTLVEPVGFVMDRRMLLGVKERVERTRDELLARPA